MLIKNSNLRRKLAQGKFLIISGIIAIILIVLLIQLLNNMAKNSIVITNTIEPKNVYRPQETVISGSEVTQEKQEQNSKIIDEFITYCNSKQIEKAYALLTEECKEEVFANKIEYFEQNYINKIFTNEKIYNIQSWINGTNVTYKIRILNDIMATGKKEDAFEDYYTIVKKDGQNYLNINSYIGRKNINKETTDKNITIHVLTKDIYKDYESYKIRVKNNTDKMILLDSKENPKSIYLTNGTQTYSGFTHENNRQDFEIRSGFYKDIKIKFNKIYSNSIQLQTMFFSDVIINFEEYQQTQDKQAYTNRVTLKAQI